MASVEETLSFEYDDPDGGTGAKGQLTSASVIPFATNSGASRVSYQYDRHRNVTRKQQLGTAPALASDYQYDDAGRLEETTLPSGAVIRYGYGADGRVVTIRVNGVVIVSEVEYFPFGEVKRWLQGNGNHYIRNFDTDGRVEDFTVAGTTRSLAYDVASRIIGLYTRQFSFERDQFLVARRSGAGERDLSLNFNLTLPPGQQVVPNPQFPCDLGTRDTRLSGLLYSASFELRTKPFFAST